MKRFLYLIASFFWVLVFLFCGNQQKEDSNKMMVTKDVIDLPKPELKGKVSIEEAIAQRRSVRNFSGGPISLQALSQILWAAQGITDTLNKFRSAPSAGALYPLEIYVVVSNVFDLSQGIYKYKPEGHKLILMKTGDFRQELMKEALWQDWISQSSVVLVFAAVYERTTWKYGKRGIQYVHMEVGHSAQNVCLQVTALGLGTTTVGAFNDEGVKKVLGLDTNEVPLYILPIGLKLE